MKKTNYFSWYFLLIVMAIYVGLGFFKHDLLIKSLDFSIKIIIQIIPIFLLVFALMTISNYFLTQKFIMKYLQRKGLIKWFFVIISGILSSGPIYMWYSLLADLRDKGVNEGLLACFLYNRAIKIPLIPLAIMFFSWQYVCVLTLVMILVSVFQGKLIDFLMSKEE